MKVKHLAIICGIILGGLIAVRSANALTEENEVDVQFTFASSLQMTISSDNLVINSLAPGSAENSNEISIGVITNNVTGYRLTATVGNSTNNSRDLVHTGGSATFSSVDVGSSSSTLASGKWGYSTNSGSTYSGLPKYDDTSSTALLNSSTGATNATTKFLIGATAAASQTAGSYSNVINFVAVANVIP